jgi:ubiquitin carboxyl-terminal hydrolase 4/11/15
MGGNNGTPIIYDLYAVSNHFGSLNGGHYTAYGYNSIANRWYEFNDSSVSSVSNP